MKLPEFTLPPILGHINEQLPQLPPTLALVMAINLGLDCLLPRERLLPLLGKHLLIRVSDAGLSLRFMLVAKEGSQSYFRPVPADPGGNIPDLSISARSCDFLALLLREENAESLFSSGRLLMEGDAELGQLARNVFDTIEWPGFSLFNRVFGH